MQTKQLNKALLALAVVAGSLGQASAAIAVQDSASDATATAGARIIAPITIVKGTNLNFGDIVAGASVGTVVIDNTGARTHTGGTTLGSASAISKATFDVGGQAASTYTISLPASVVITETGGGTMTVDGFNSNPAGTGTLDGSGAQTINVGATLNVGSPQAQGSYTGTYTVTVAYN